MSDATIKMPAGFWNGLTQLGIAPYDVPRKAGLPLTIINESYVTTSQYFAIWDAYSDMVDDIADGIIKMVNAFETAHYPAAVQVTYHARDYRDALRRMARYKQLCPPENLSITEVDDVCTIELDGFDKGESVPPVLIGITLAFLLELGRRGTGHSLQAKSVAFSTPMGDVEKFEDYFGCPVQIHSNCNRLTLYRKDLDRTFLSYNEELLDILTPALNQSLDEQKREQTITGTVKWILDRRLASGTPSIQAVASEMGMSARTLQRRMTDEGTSFNHLLNDVRHDHARRYLADSTIDMKEVAFLVGYADQNSFYRAFRIWEGDTPAKWRTQHLKN